METLTAKSVRQTKRRLKAELDLIVERLQTDARVPATSVPAGDFLDIAQGVEDQELARLSASRLTERARRLRVALTRVSDGHYGECSECGQPIPGRRLAAMPDATTCVACQERLERRANASATATEEA